MAHTTLGAPHLPFVGLAESYVVATFRRTGVLDQRIRSSLEVFRAEVGDHMLVSQHLHADGREVLNGHITGAQAAGRCVDNLPAILDVSRSPGPFIYGVYPSHVQTLTLI